MKTKAHERLREWLCKEIRKCEREIDKGSPFHFLESRKITLEDVIEQIDEMR